MELTIQALLVGVWPSESSLSKALTKVCCDCGPVVSNLYEVPSCLVNLLEWTRGTHYGSSMANICLCRIQSSPTRKKKTLCLSAFLSSQIDRGYSRAHSSKQQTDRAVGRGGSLAEQAKGRLSSPVMTTSRRPSPWMKLAYRGPGSSLPRPYDGSGSTSGHLLVSCARGSPCTHTMHSISTHPVYYSKHALHCIAHDAIGLFARSISFSS